MLGNTAELFKGLIPGAIGLAETAGVGLSALLPESAERTAREGIANIAGIAKAPFAAAPGYEESVGRKLGEGLGSTGPLFALGPLGAAGRLAGVGIGASAGAGEARLGAESKGATESERATATALGIAPGMFDMLAPSIPRIRTFLGKNREGIESMMITALARGGVEGATEAAQKIAQNAIAQGVYNPSQSLIEGSGEEGAYGAAVGTIASMVIDMTIGRKQYGSTAPQTPAQPPATTPAAPGAPVPPRDLGTQAGLEYAYGETGDLLARPERVDLGTPPPAPKADAAERIAEAQELAQERRRLDRLITQAKTPQETQQLQTALGAVDSQLEKFADVPTPEGIKLTLPAKTTFPDAVTLYRAENAPLYNGGELWTTSKKEAEGQGRVSTITLPREVVAANAQAGASEGQFLFAGTAPDKLYEAAKSPDPMLRAAVDAVIGAGSPSISVLQDKLNIDFSRAAILMSQLEQIGVAAPAQDGKPRELVGDAAKAAQKLQGNLTESMADKRGEAARKQAEEERAKAEAARAKTEQEYGDLFGSGTTAADGRVYPSEPGQPDLPFPIERGGPQPDAAEPEPEVEKEFQRVLTPEFLTSIGLPKQSGYFKKLSNVDMADTANHQMLGELFYGISQNPNLSQRTKDAVERIKGQAFGALTTQGQMFGPRGGISKEAKEQEAKGAQYQREQQKAEKAEAKKKADAEATAKKKADAEAAAKKKADAEAKKKADEAEAKKKADAEAKKKADEAEAKKKADEAEAKKRADEAEAKKKAAAEQAQNEADAKVDTATTDKDESDEEVYVQMPLITKKNKMGSASMKWETAKQKFEEYQKDLTLFQNVLTCLVSKQKPK
jgi:hypothetical protein